MSRFGAAGSQNNWQTTLELTGPPRALVRIDLVSTAPTGGPQSLGVEARLPRGGWQSIGIDRMPDWNGGQSDSILLVPIRTTALRLTVYQADPPNEPLRVTGVFATPAGWEFEPTPDGHWWLGWGDPFAVPEPEGMTTAPTMPAEASVAMSTLPLRTTLGPPEANPYHREPGFGLEWLRRRPVVLSVVMLAILILAVWLARRPARKP
jgi:hypothetical protein